MKEKNLAAFTDIEGALPPYLSINQKNDTVSISVRGRVHDDGGKADLATIVMTNDQFAAILHRLNENFEMPAHNNPDQHNLPL